jgi:hypothetical protein
MLVPRNAEGFSSTLNALRSLDGSKEVGFHTTSLLEDRCVRLLVKKLGRYMPENVVQGEWRIWESVSRESCRSGRNAVTMRSRFASFGVNVHRSKWTSDVKALSSFRPYASGTGATHTGILRVVRLTSQRSDPPHSRNIIAAAVDESKPQTTHGA